MSNIANVSARVRKARKSHKVTLYFQYYLQEVKLAKAELLDLKEYNFPIFEDTLKTLQNPSEKVLDFANKIKLADGVIIVDPKYNGGFPASLKNVIELLYEEWHGKPISISTVSSGIFGGPQALVTLQFVLWKIGAKAVSNRFPVPKVPEIDNEDCKTIEKFT